MSLLCTCRQPDDAHCLGSYAVYLHRIKKDYTAAEAMYKKVMLNPHSKELFPLHIHTFALIPSEALLNKGCFAM